MYKYRNDGTLKITQEKTTYFPVYKYYIWFPCSSSQVNIHFWHAEVPNAGGAIPVPGQLQKRYDLSDG